MAETSFQYQDSLPHLPVPKLQDTLQRYLRSVQAIVSDDQYSKTKEIVEEFGKSGGLGEKLTQKLKERAKTHDNWVDDFWIRYAYLSVREPLMIKCSPVLSIIYRPVQTVDEQLRLAAKVLFGILQHNHAIQSETLPVDKVAGRAICMSQYKKIFNGYRIPGEKLDSAATFTAENPQPSNLIVAYKDQFFSVDVIKDGKFLTVADIYGIFKEITEKHQDRGKGVGVFTAINRDSCFEAYTELMKDKTNANNLEKIIKSLFVLAIESHELGAETDDGNQIKAKKPISTICKQLLTGCGIEGDACNRWYDKRLQITVGIDGSVTLIGEHSAIDGTAVLELCKQIIQTSGCPDNDLKPTELPSIQKLEWNLNENLENRIRKGKVEAASTINDISVEILKWEEYGKEFIKSQKMSPDSFMQILFQVAYYKTEVIRSTSVESVEFINAFLSDSVSNDQKKALFRKAVEVHKKYALQASMGQGWDRHLFGMKIWALENGMETPAIFSDPTYNTLSQFKLSTSQVTLPTDTSVACFAPVVEDGYGISYNISSNFFIVSVTSFNSCSKTSATEFYNALIQTLNGIKLLLES
ncbi:Carnitine O-acetyltransferase [Trichoplax sp. H2]|nr:Carnitine O-acetyltransferase [Trichoplax sp. H2]|eukprot:RDD45432.1 Carnitine O-acetyltransferase [Trichoplax sp. H2]